MLNRNPDRLYQDEVFFAWDAAFDAGGSKIGGKAWNLSRLRRYGFNVPPGGVVPVAVYEQLMRQNRLMEACATASREISIDNVTSEFAENLLSQLRGGIVAATLDEDVCAALLEGLGRLGLLQVPVAVRSSATFEDSAVASFAGIHDSFLNISGEHAILDCVKRCFASVWLQRAVAYRRKMKIDDGRVLPAVIVMAMVDADAAGVAFSCDPASGREDVCVISANYGVGESVVDGGVDADSYTVDRAEYKPVSVRLGRKQAKTVLLKQGGTRQMAQNAADRRVLSDTQLSTLAVLIGRAYAALGDAERHQDMEWALKDDAFFVLQSRPVTALPRCTQAGMQDHADIWSNGNFRDALPMVIKPLQWEAILASLNRTILAPLRDIGYAVQPGLSVARYFQGRVYFNSALYQWLLYDALGVPPGDLNLYMGGHHDNIEVPKRSPYIGRHGLRRLIRLLKYMGMVSKATKNKQRYFEKVDRFYEYVMGFDFASLSDAELLDFVESFSDEFTAFTDKYMALCGGVGPLGMAIKKLQPYFGEDAIGIANALAIGQGEMPSAEQGYRLLQLAEIARDEEAARQCLTEQNIIAQTWRDLAAESPFRREFAAYLRDYGHRGTYEMDHSKPRWSEEPGYLLRNIAKTLDFADLEAHKRRQRQLQQQAMTQLRSRAGWFKSKWIMYLISQGVKGAQVREESKSHINKLVTLMRRIYLDAGRRLRDKGVIDADDDVFFASQADVVAVLNGQWDGDGLSVLIQERKEKIQVMEAEPVADVLIENKPRYEQAKPEEGDNRYRGIGVSAGIAQGCAQVIRTPEEGVRLNPGDIMVSPSTDSAWTPLFIHAGGIVLETGGYTSHGSIVAREYGIPAVVNIAGVTQLVKNGETLVVNGNNGTISMDGGQEEDRDNT